MTRRTRWLSFLVVAWVFIAASAVFSQDPTGRPTDRRRPTNTRRPPPPDPRTIPIILTVLTDPPESTILINGESKGLSNVDGKLQIEKLAQGAYTIEVRKEGYTSAVRNFQAGAESPTLVFKLEPNFEEFDKQFSSLVGAGKLTGPDSPNAMELVEKVSASFPDRPEVTRMRGVLATKLIETVGPLVDRTVTDWRVVSRQELVTARESAVLASSLKSDDTRLSCQVAYLKGAIALRDWQTGSNSTVAEPEAGVEPGKGNGESSGADGLSTARAEFERAVALDDASAAAWYQLGLVRLNLGDLAGAQTAFVKVSLLEPRWANSQAGLGAAYYAWAKYKESIDAYRKAIDLDKSYAPAYAGLGLARSAKGEKDGVKDIRRAMELDPESGLPHLYLGMVYSKSKKRDERARAAEELKQAVQKNQRHSNLEFQNRTVERLLAELQTAKK